jgi:hypothetical protein
VLELPFYYEERNIMAKMLEFSRGKSQGLEFKAARFVTSPIHPVKSDEHQFYKRHLLVEKDGSALGCDGSRLHRVTDFQCGVLPVEPGYYKVVKRNRNQVWLLKECDREDQFYPDYTMALKAEGSKQVEFPLLMQGGLEHEAYSKLIRAIPSSNCLNFHFITEICDTLDGEVDVTINFDERTDFHTREKYEYLEKPVHFKRVLRYPEGGGEAIFAALIMPMNIRRVTEV